MPVKKSSTTAKKTAPKAVVSPAVIVKENPIKKTDCCTPGAKNCCKMGGMVAVLLIINTILLIALFFRGPSKSAIYGGLADFEALRVGGTDNYKIMKEILELDAYKQDQAKRLQTTLDFLKNPEAAKMLPDAEQQAQQPAANTQTTP